MSRVSAGVGSLALAFVGYAFAGCGGRAAEDVSTNVEDAGVEAEAAVDAAPRACKDYATPGEACRASVDCQWIASNTRMTAGANAECTFDSLLRKCGADSTCLPEERCVPVDSVADCDPENADFIAQCFAMAHVCWPR